MLLMLEDNADRIERFTATLRSIDPELPLRVWRNAWTMIRELNVFLPAARLISLDHDLEPEDGGPTGPDQLPRLLLRKPGSGGVPVGPRPGERGEFCGDAVSQCCVIAISI